MFSSTEVTKPNKTYSLTRVVVVYGYFPYLSPPWYTMYHTETTKTTVSTRHYDVFLEVESRPCVGDAAMVAVGQFGGCASAGKG